MVVSSPIIHYITLAWHACPAVCRRATAAPALDAPFASSFRFHAPTPRRSPPTITLRLACLLFLFPTLPPHCSKRAFDSCTPSLSSLACLFFLQMIRRHAGVGGWKGWMEGRGGKKERQELRASLSSMPLYSLPLPPSSSTTHTGFVYVHGLLLSHEEKWWQVSSSFRGHACFSPPPLPPPSLPPPGFLAKRD